MPPRLPRLVCPRKNNGGSTKDDDGARPFKVSGQSHLQPQGSKKNLLLLHPLQPLSALQPLAQLQALAVSQVQTLRQLCSAPESLQRRRFCFFSCSTSDSPWRRPQFGNSSTKWQCSFPSTFHEAKTVHSMRDLEKFLERRMFNSIDYCADRPPEPIPSPWRHLETPGPASEPKAPPQRKYIPTFSICT